MGNFVVYLTIYDGDEHPPYYIGSTSLERIEHGYKGSPRSKKWRSIVKEEMKNNPSSYDVLILSYHNSRKEALAEEDRLIRLHDCPHDEKFYNMAYASVDGYFGVSMKGDANPMYGVTPSSHTREKASESNRGVVIASDDDGVTWKRMRVEDYHRTKEVLNLITPKGEFSEKIVEKTRERVRNKTHHFCDPAVQKKIAESRKGVYKAPEHVKTIVSNSMKEYYSDWENKTLGDNRDIWMLSLEIYDFMRNQDDAYTKAGVLRKSVSRLVIEYIESLGVDPRVETRGWAKVVSKIKKGWNPRKDEKYLCWRNSNES